MTELAGKNRQNDRKYLYKESALLRIMKASLRLYEKFDNYLYFISFVHAHYGGDLAVTIF